MSLPDAAVEAAAKAFAQSDPGNTRWWDHMLPQQKTRWTDRARVALEAALPHLVTQAKVQALKVEVDYLTVAAETADKDPADPAYSAGVRYACHVLLNDIEELERT